MVEMSVREFVRHYNIVRGAHRWAPPGWNVRGFDKAKIIGIAPDGNIYVIVDHDGADREFYAGHAD